MGFLRKNFDVGWPRRIIWIHFFGKLKTRRRCRNVLGRHSKVKYQNESEKGKDFGAHLSTRIIKTPRNGTPAEGPKSLFRPWALDGSFFWLIGKASQIHVFGASLQKVKSQRINRTWVAQVTILDKKNQPQVIFSIVF